MIIPIDIINIIVLLVELNVNWDSLNSINESSMKQERSKITPENRSKTDVNMFTITINRPINITECLRKKNNYVKMPRITNPPK